MFVSISPSPSFSIPFAPQPASAIIVLVQRLVVLIVTGGPCSHRTHIYFDGHNKSDHYNSDIAIRGIVISGLCCIHCPKKETKSGKYVFGGLGTAIYIFPDVSIPFREQRRAGKDAPPCARYEDMCHLYTVGACSRFQVT